MAEDETVQTSEASSATPAPAAPVVGTGPWQADIEAAFADPQVAANVDAFLRSKVQPRMTRLEQQAAVADNAKTLWDAFQEDPAAAYAAITRELYGDEPAQAALEALQTRLQTSQQPVTQEPQAPAQPQFDPNSMLTPEEVQAFRERREAEMYDAALDEILGDPANADIDRDLFHTYVAAAQGDFEDAIQRYRSHVSEVLTRFGIDPNTATPVQASAAATVAEGEQAAAGAPPVMGQQAGGAGAAPPTQPEYRGTDGLHKAIEDATNQMLRNNPAPPVS